MQPVFSIITITRNCSTTILRCLDSIAGQSYHDYEHLVIDGGSTDGTLELLKARCFQLSSLVSEPDNGIYDALNKGIAQASGDIVGILHADDIFHGEKVLSNVSDVFKVHSNVDVVIGNVAFFDPKNPTKVIRRINSAYFRPWMLRFGFMPAHTATFIRRSLFDQLGPYRSDYKTAGDFEFFVRLIAIHKIKPYYLKETLVYMSVGGTSSSGWKSYIRTTTEILCCLREKYIYSNWFFVMARLPLKFFNKCIFQLSYKINR